MEGIERLIIEYSGENEDGSAALAILSDDRNEMRLLRMLRDEDARRAYNEVRKMIEGGYDVKR